MLAHLNPVNAGLLGLLLASIASSSPITPVTSVDQLFHKNMHLSMLLTQTVTMII